MSATAPMRRFKDYSKVVAWQAGLAYLALWAVTFWTLDEGGIVFGRAGACYADSARVLFYWVCDSGSPLNLLAAVSNLALTVTVWAPVYVAAATVQSEAVPIALPIVAVHAVGLPLGLFVLIRLMAIALDIKHLWPNRPALAGTDGSLLAAAVASTARD